MDKSKYIVCRYEMLNELVKNIMSKHMKGRSGAIAHMNLITWTIGLWI